MIGEHRIPSTITVADAIFQLYDCKVLESTRPWSLQDCIFFCSAYLELYDENYALYNWDDEQTALFNPRMIKRNYHVFNSRQKLIKEYGGNPYHKEFFESATEYDEITFWENFRDHADACFLGPYFTPSGEYSVFLQYSTVKRNANDER